MDGLPIVWMILARVFIAGSVTCKTTNPTLFTFVDWYSSFMMIFLTLQFMIKCVGMFLLHHWVARNGELPEWMQNILQRANAASPDTINKIETVEYEPSLFADPSDPADERPAGECCICLQAYDADLEIKRTQCGHLAHTECLQEWLKRARTCPTCRKDLEEACQTGEEQPPENCDSEYVV
jgi:E3 ubiquitin-protein ligase SDIR1